MGEDVKWIEYEAVKFEKEFKETMQQIFWDEFVYGTSCTKVEDGKLIRIMPFSDEYNKIISNERVK